MLIGERNARAIRVLREQLMWNKRRLAIFYGAGHMPDLERRLVQGLGFTLESIEWVTAWTVGPDPKPTTSPATQSSR